MKLFSNRLVFTRSKNIWKNRSKFIKIGIHFLVAQNYQFLIIQENTMKLVWPRNWEHLLLCGSTKQSTDHKADPISYPELRNKTVNFNLSKVPPQWPKRRPQDLQPLPNEYTGSAPALHGAPAGDWVLIGSTRHLESSQFAAWGLICISRKPAMAFPQRRTWGPQEASMRLGGGFVPPRLGGGSRCTQIVTSLEPQVNDQSRTTLREYLQCSP